MAENENILTRLGKLFQIQIVLRKTPSGQIKVKDVDFTQTALTSNFIDRYQRLIQNTYSNPYSVAQNRRAAYEIRKHDLFKDYELMDQDPIIASALDIYSDESTVDNIEGEILTVQTDNVKVQKILHEEGIKYAFSTSSTIIKKNSNYLSLGRAPMLNFANKAYVCGSALGAFDYWDKILNR